MNYKSVINYFKNMGLNQIYFCLIVISISYAIIQMFCTFYVYGDSGVYFQISKNILSHRWYELILDNQGWLDKPHFPFWITSISFYFFGVKAFSYILPGLLFYFIGAFYTFKLTCELYQDLRISLLSVLFFLSTINLIISAMNIKAETYLIGEIIPAVYYLYLYNKLSNFKNLFLSGLFSALAIMTKGIFVLLPIFSGLFTILFLRNNFFQILSLKFLKVYVLIFIFITPEIIATYLQFGFEGVKWFVFESQFGRFFGFGRISTNNGSLIFYFKVFLWAFLPWSLFFLYGTYNLCTRLLVLLSKEKENFIFLLSSFFYTFLLFSISKFQFKDYTNIIFPFSAILTAVYLKYFGKNYFIFNLQVCIYRIVLILSIVLLVLPNIRNHDYYTLSIILVLLALVVLVLDFKNNIKNYELRAVIFSVLSALIFTSAHLLVINTSYSKYNIAYIIQNILTNKTKLPVYTYRNRIETPLVMGAKNIINLKDIDTSKSFYLVIDDNDYLLIEKEIPNKFLIASKIPYCPPRIFWQSIFKSHKKFLSSLKYKIVVKVIQ